MISNEEIQKVREATDIAALIGETVMLRPRGADLWGCCPFHHEKNPSFHVTPDRGRWKCFGCGKGGDCFGFVMERDNVDFPDAVRILADRAGIELREDDASARRFGSRTKKSRLHDAMQAAVDFYHHQLTRVRGGGADAARAYLAGRGMGSAVAERWGLGYAPGSGSLVRELTRQGFTRQELLDAKLAIERNGSLRDFFYERVTIPIRDKAGKPVAIGGRTLSSDSGVPKYVNSQESAIYNKSRTVFALDRAKASVVTMSEAVIVEGYFDAISMHEAGICNAVAPCGTALTPRQLKMITDFLKPSTKDVSRGRIVCLFDADEAGQMAAERAFQFAGTTTTPMYRVVLPQGKDPDEFLRNHGADELRALIASSEPLARFVIDRHLAQFDVTTPEGRANALADVVRAMGPIKGTPLGSDYVQYVSDRLMADSSTVRASLAQVEWVPPVDRDADESESIIVDGRTARLDYDEEPERAEVPAASVPAPVRLLPEDARMIRVEHEVLATISADVDGARAFADRIATITWADPRDEAIAWALLATPEGTTPLQAIGAAEAVVPEGAAILADGDSALASEQDNARALSILLDDLEMKSLRRQIDQGRARLNSLDAGGDPGAFNALFSELTGYQQRLKELEAGLRTMK